MEDRQVADRSMEIYAKQQGFPSYAAMVAFYKHRSQPEPEAARRPSLSDALALHPARLLDYVLEKYRNATGS